MPDQPQDKPPDPASRRGPMVALAVVVAIVIGGFWLSRTLTATSRIQDCVMAGRSNCAPIPSGR